MKRYFAPLVLCFFIVTAARAQHTRDTITILGVGDIMPGTNFPADTFLPPDSGKGLFTAVLPMLAFADLLVANLEGVLLDSGGTAKKCSDMSKCFAFRIPRSYVNRLTEAGFDVMGLANNHSGDFGDAGRQSTMKTLEKAGIEFAGLHTCPSVQFEKNGIRWGFAAFSPFRGTADMMNADSAALIVKALEKNCDIVIVAVHAGAEGATARHVTRKTEIFYDEDRGNIYEFSHRMIDAGADIIFGHGPHVTRAVEIYKDRFIAYSLGNFCTYKRFNLRGSNGAGPAIMVYTDARGKFLKAQVHSIRQYGDGIPSPDPENTALKELLELTREDFPEGKISISPQGIILPE